MVPARQTNDSIPGYVAVERPHAVALARPDARSWVEASLSSGGTLYRAASESRDRTTMEGRGPVYAVPAPRGEPERALGIEGGRWVVRHYRRGGWMAPLLGDLYLNVGTPRPLRELEVSREVRSRGIPTPAVVAAAVYPAGVFYRGDLVTELVPDARELAHVLFDRRRRGFSGSVDRREALLETGALIRKLGTAGVHHPDLNARNVLLQWSGGAPRGHVLDLDRCRLSSGPRPDLARAMRERLSRSLRKLEKKFDLRIPPGEWKALEKGLEG